MSQPRQSPRLPLKLWSGPPEQVLDRFVRPSKCSTQGKYSNCISKVLSPLSSPGTLTAKLPGRSRPMSAPGLIGGLYSSENLRPLDPPCERFLSFMNCLRCCMLAPPNAGTRPRPLGSLPHDT